MIQQLTDRHLLSVQRELRHVLREIVIQLHAPLFHELHDRGGRELLRVRSDLVDRRGGRRAPRIHVGETVRAIRQRIVPANHRERRTRRVRFGEIGEDERVGARTERVARDGRTLGGGRREAGEHREAGEAGRTRHCLSAPGGAETYVWYRSIATENDAWRYVPPPRRPLATFAASRNRGVRHAHYCFTHPGTTFVRPTTPII